MKKLIVVAIAAALLSGCGPSPEEIASRERAAEEQKHNQRKAEAMDAINRAPFPCGEIVRLEEDFADRATCSNGEVYIIRYINMPVGKKVAISCSAFDKPEFRRLIEKYANRRITKEACITAANPYDAFQTVMVAMGYREDAYGRWSK
jgi:hypothetical protein